MEWILNFRFKVRILEHNIPRQFGIPTYHYLFPNVMEQFFNFLPVIPLVFISVHIAMPPDCPSSPSPHHRIFRPRHCSHLTDKSKRHFERKIPHKASHIPHPIRVVCGHLAHFPASPANFPVFDFPALLVLFCFDLVCAYSKSNCLWLFYIVLLFLRLFICGEIPKTMGITCIYYWQYSLFISVLFFC